MNERLKVKFLTVIWGARYIEEFSRVSLPSYLAPGNLPFVARETNLEIVIMTSKDSLKTFAEMQIFERLKAVCPVRFIFIDDLITTGVYGVTLTLAYARGIRDSGAEQTNTHFIFMNSDFVLADGSLATVVRRLKEGQRCIMAPSLRASSETALPVLYNAVDQSIGTLTRAPRELVKLAFDNLHPTVIAKTVTQDFISCITHNQIYWQVDENTLLGRYHLIFMLAIKPEVPLAPVNSYCDYGFVPEMIPSGQFSVLSDLDEFFMLELQSREQEGFMLRSGTLSPGEIAEELLMWVTGEHRKFAEHDIVFHSDDLPPALQGVRSKAAAFVAELHGLMGHEHLTHVRHAYWTSGVQAWAMLKYAAASDTPQLPDEIERQRIDLQEKSPRENWETPGYRTRLISHIRRWAGVIPNVPIWNHYWLDFASSAMLGRLSQAVPFRTKPPHLRFDEPAAQVT